MKNKKITSILLGIYIILLTWIIVFKMQLSWNFPYIRSINLIPFAESVIINGKIYFSEIFNNCLVFIPVGLYLSMIFKDSKFYKKALPVFLLSFIYESLQFILHIGASDITDIISNTLGGIVGILLINFLYKVFKNNEKIDKILNILAMICTAIIVVFLSLLIIVNL